mmetsp:Transcript_26182/g.47181  ORF Transcript_26182/g.47181 Transcript_26182/m.47181 type:complete len:210 (-) Transcript_26182:139-768(-)
MSDYSEAASAAGIATSTTAGGATTAGAGGMDNAELLRIMQGALGGSQGGIHDAIDAEGARTSTVPGSDSIPLIANGSAGGQQVDALGNILENLGMPNNGTPAAAGGAAATAAGGLTLSDLQGAMAGLATASPPSAATATATAGAPLSELASSSIINESGILNDPKIDEEEKEMDGEEGGGSGETKEDGGGGDKDEKDGDNDGDGKMDES